MHFPYLAGHLFFFLSLNRQRCRRRWSTKEEKRETNRRNQSVTHSNNVDVLFLVEREHGTAAPGVLNVYMLYDDVWITCQAADSIRTSHTQKGKRIERKVSERIRKEIYDLDCLIRCKRASKHESSHRRQVGNQSVVQQYCCQENCQPLQTVCLCKL